MKMKLLKKIKNYFHVCCYSKPLISQYRTFDSRNIIFQCRCGNKESIIERRYFSDDFSINTNTLITDKQFNSILKSKKIF